MMIDGLSVLIDTGCPFSMAPRPLKFLGELYEFPNNINGITPQKLSDLGGFQIDALFGCNILSKHTLRIRWRDGKLDIGNDVPHGLIKSEFLTFDKNSNFPIVFPVTIADVHTKAILDTGAHLSYIDPTLLQGLTPSGQREDFHIFVGRYTVNTCTVATALDNVPIDIEYGFGLPEPLQMFTSTAMRQTKSRAVLGTQLFEFFDCTINWQQKLISWERR